MFPSVGKQQQMCGVSATVAHVLRDDLPDRCDLSAAWGGEHVSPLTFTPGTLVPKRTPPPRSRSAVCSPFPALTFCFRRFHIF